MEFGRIVFRRFAPEDAEFCFKIRAGAFIREFYNEIGPDVVSACVTAYMPNDYIRMAEHNEFFIVTENSEAIGFFTIKKIGTGTAEIPLIYLDLNHTRKGTGKKCIRYIEEWVATNWKDVRKLFVDTIIPKYNRVFYEKVGFSPTEETYCFFADKKVRALRFCKRLSVDV